MASTPPVRVAVVNDYEIVVAGVASLLEPFSDRVRVVELDSNVPVLTDVDVILFDTFSNERADRIDLGSLVQGSEAKVVVFSWNTDPSLVRGALANGVAGYLPKGLDGSELVDALERVCRGERVVPDADPRSADDAGTWPGKELGLTARESEVLVLITQGLSNQEIAERCYLSINSVKTYIRTAYRKLGVNRRAQAVAWGIRNGFEPDVSRLVRLDGRVDVKLDLQGRTARS